MPSIKFKKNLLLTLIATAVILIAANFFFDSDLLSDSSDSNTIDKEEIRQRFLNILAAFDIEDKFVKENKVKDKHSRQEISSFKVQVPKDLSIPEILQDVSILTPYGVDYRYPGDYPNVSGRDAEQALRFAERVRAEIRNRLPRHVLE